MGNRENRKFRRQGIITGQAAQPQQAETVAQSESVEAANTKLADFAHAQRQRDEVKQRDKRNRATSTTGRLPDLPPMPRAPRKPKAGKPCECGCAEMTRGGRFIPGHDARLYAWARRVEKGVVKLAEVPEPHTEAVARLLKQTQPSKVHTPKAAPAKAKAEKRGVAR